MDTALRIISFGARIIQVRIVVFADGSAHDPTCDRIRTIAHSPATDKGVFEIVHIPGNIGIAI